MASTIVRKIFLLVFFICVREIYALDVSITEKEVEAHLRGEYNRSVHLFGDISAIGAVDMNDRLTFRSGLSVGGAEGITDIKAFTSARFGLLAKWPLGLALSYIYNGLPEYETHSHTVLPSVSYNTKYGGIAIGPSLRFTSFFKEPAIFEPIISIIVHANFINSERLRIGVSFSNFNDFQSNNFGLYSLCFNSAARINSWWSVLNEVEFKQSGGDGLSANLYGIALRGGVKFTW